MSVEVDDVVQSNVTMSVTIVSGIPKISWEVILMQIGQSWDLAERLQGISG